MHTHSLLRRLRALLPMTVLSLVLAACGAPEAVHRVDAQAFSDAIAKPGVTIIDVRTISEYSAGHLQGAVNMDVEGMTFANDILDLDKTKTYAVYCASGARSYKAATMMSDAGFTDVYDLDGGVMMWQAAGLPLVTG